MEQDPSTLLYTSDDLDGSYESQCPYVPGGGIKNDGSTTCGGQDMLFTFTGHVGKITSVPDRDAYEDQYGVTFNGGRTTYMFSEEEIKVEVRQKKLQTKSLFIVMYVLLLTYHP